MNSAAAAWSHQSLLADCAPPYLRTTTAPHSRGPRGVRTRRGGCIRESLELVGLLRHASVEILERPISALGLSMYLVPSAYL